jgi:hypothetical protein
MEPVDVRRETASKSREAQEGLSALGIAKTLGALLTGNTVITETALAEVLGKHPISIKRAVQRGELPPSVHFCGEPAWTAVSILRHVESRMEEARKEAEEAREREREEAKAQEARASEVEAKIKELSL